MNWGIAGRTDVNGKALECASFGPSPDKAPTIVMLHEGLGSVGLWRDLPGRLAQLTGYGVLAYSRAGYGQSDACDLPRPTDYQTREALDVLPQVLDAAGVQKTVLLGHSDGATMAAIYAGTCADMRVRGLILMAPHFFVEPVGMAAIAKARQAYETGDLKARLAKYHANVDAAFLGWNDAWLGLAEEDWNVGEVIDYLRIPTLAIQGAQDEYGTRAQIDELVARSYAPVDVAWLQNCGHIPHQDQPEATLAAIEEFCERLRRIEEAQVAA